MKIALASVDFINYDIEYNYNQILKYSKEAKAKAAELICFGEAFLQGFDSIVFDYHKDIKIAICINDDYINKLRLFAKDNSIAIAFGFYENDSDCIYSTYLVIDNNGNIVDHYKRVSKTWRPSSSNDNLYKEGKSIYTFKYNDLKMTSLLCGDFWHYNIFNEVKTLAPDLVIWPVYLSWDIAWWQKEEDNYVKRMFEINTNIAMINSICNDDIDKAVGGCLYVKKPTCTLEKLPFGKQEIILINVR